MVTTGLYNIIIALTFLNRRDILFLWVSVLRFENNSSFSDMVPVTFQKYISVFLRFYKKKKNEKNWTMENY